MFLRYGAPRTNLSINFRRVFAGEGAAAVMTESAIRIADDFALSARCHLRTADHESSGRIDVYLRLTVKQIASEYRENDVILNFVAHLLKRRLRMVLCRYYDGIDMYGAIPSYRMVTCDLPSGQNDRACRVFSLPPFSA